MVVSFFFFLAMLVAFYVRRHIGYFALSTAFLVIYIFTLIGWVIQKRSVVRIFENGIRHRNFFAAWDEIVGVKADSDGLTITKGPRDKTLIRSSVSNYAHIVNAVKQGVERSSD